MEHRAVNPSARITAPFVRPVLALLLAIITVPVHLAAAEPEATPETTYISGPALGWSISRVGGVRTEEAMTPLDLRWQSEIGSDRYDPWSVIPLDPGEPLRAELRLQVQYENPILVRMFLLLDYRQVPFSLIPVEGPAIRESSQPLTLPDPLPGFDPEAAQPTTDITATSADVMNFLIVADAPSAGVHDMTVVFVPAADTRADALPYSSWHHPTSTMTVVVGDAAPPSGWPSQLEPLDPDATVDPQFRGGCFMTPNPESRQMWPGQQAAPGETLDLFLRCSISGGLVLQADQTYATPEGYAGADGDNLPIIFLGFLDDRVVPIVAPETPPVAEIPGAIVGTVPLDAVAVIPIQIQLPDEPGAYSFFVHRFPTPYAPPIRGQGPDMPLLGQTSTQRVVFDVVAE